MALFSDDLTVFHDDNSSFTDFSFEAQNFIRDEFSVELVSAEDYLYVGLFKPFDRLYVEMRTANTNANTFDAEYWNGTAFVDLSNFLDLSKGMTRSGMITWTKSDDWASTTVNSENLFWIRMKPSADHSVGTEIQGLNIVFSDDDDMREEYRNVDSLRNRNDTSFIAFHQAAREWIVQKLRNQGNVKRDNQFSAELLDITKWDLLKSEQVNEASKFMALARVFDNASDNSDGKFWQLARKYERSANEQFQLFLLTLDNDNDGIIDDAEKSAITFARITRV